jgi:hypothetical protein
MMQIRKYLTIYILSLIFLSTNIRADGGFSTTGTTGFVFLSLPVSARYVSMGETGITLDNAGADGLFINPALGARVDNKNNLSLTYGNWYMETGHHSLAYIRKFPVLGSFGVSINYFDFGSIQKTRTISASEISTLQPEDNNIYIDLGSYSAYGLAAAFSYSRFLTTKFSFGANLKYVREAIDKYYTDNVLVDLGFIYNTGIGPLRVGAYLNNFGLETEYVDESFKMPQKLVLGVSGEVFGSLNDPTYVTVLAEAIHPNDAAERVHFGAEARIANLILLRAGYKYGYEFENFTFGLGAKFVYRARPFRFDLSYMNHEYLEQTIRYTLSMGM